MTHSVFERNAEQLLQRQEGQLFPCRCGESTYWSLADSCDATIEEILTEPREHIVVNLRLPVDVSDELLLDYLFQRLRNRVQGECGGRA